MFPRMRTTAGSDDDVFEAAQAQAPASGRELDDVSSQLVRGSRASAQSANKNGLPVFKVPADAEIIPTSRAKELFGEDAT
jgi:hypothetical protein